MKTNPQNLPKKLFSTYRLGRLANELEWQLTLIAVLPEQWKRWPIPSHCMRRDLLLVNSIDGEQCEQAVELAFQKFWQKIKSLNLDELHDTAIDELQFASPAAGRSLSIDHRHELIEAAFSRSLSAARQASKRVSSLVEKVIKKAGIELSWFRVGQSVDRIIHPRDAYQRVIKIRRLKSRPIRGYILSGSALAGARRQQHYSVQFLNADEGILAPSFDLPEEIGIQLDSCGIAGKHVEGLFKQCESICEPLYRRKGTRKSPPRITSMFRKDLVHRFGDLVFEHTKVLKEYEVNRGPSHSNGSLLQDGDSSDHSSRFSPAQKRGRGRTPDCEIAKRNQEMLNCRRQTQKTYKEIAHQFGLNGADAARKGIKCAEKLEGSRGI